MSTPETASTSAEAAKGGAVSSPGSVELELYKLAVEMADRISARRALANTFFLTVNTGLAALLGGQDLRWYVAAAGIVFALAWWWLLQSYRKLNCGEVQGHQRDRAAIAPPAVLRGVATPREHEGAAEAVAAPGAVGMA